MEVFLNRVDGIDDSIISMFLSKRTLTRELEMDIRNETLKCSNMNYDGVTPLGALQDNLSEKMEDWLAKLFKWGVKHYTMLRFIDLSFTVYGLHRAGQDDIDAHAMRIHWSNVIITSNKQMVRGDILIDDGLHNLVGGEYEKVLMTAPHNKDFSEEEHYGIRRVNNWDEAYNVVCEIAQEGR